MKKRALCAAIICCLGLAKASEERGAIQSDRPGQSIGASVVGTGMLQIQSGVEVNKDERSTMITDGLILSNYVRLGLSEHFEINSMINLRSDDTTTNGVASTQDGVSDLHLGFRSSIISSARGFVPALAIQTSFKLDTVSSPFRTNNMAPMVTLAAAHNLAQTYTLTTNLGVDYNGNDSIPEYFWTSNIAHMLNDQWGVFFEVYGNFISSQGRFYVNAGFDYLIRQSFKLDFSLGRGENRGVEETFVSAGFSWRTGIFESNQR